MAAWDYSSKNGQHKWGEHCKIGTRQSPIDIVHEDTTFDDQLSINLLDVNQEVGCSFTVLNKGVNISFSPKEVNGEAKISGGPLASTYRFKECHFHWGRNATPGSEHLINGDRSEAELHLVHFKEGEESPLESGNGLCVLGIRLVVSDQTNPELKKLLKLFKDATFKGDQKESGDVIKIYQIWSDIRGKFYTYDGSLTTPPLAECVKWIVFSEPVTISREDFDISFGAVYAVNRGEESNEYYDPFTRSDCCTCGEKPKIGDNYRDICDLNGRKITRSFK